MEITLFGVAFMSNDFMYTVLNWLHGLQIINKLSS